MTVEELAEAIEKLQDVDREILEAFREGRVDDYPSLRKRQIQARDHYDELADRSFRQE